MKWRIYVQIKCSIEQTCFADGVLTEVVTVFLVAGELADCLSRGF